jgi:hypothetical protein
LIICGGFSPCPPFVWWTSVNLKTAVVNKIEKGKIRKREKKNKKSRKYGFLTVFLKNGVVGSSKKGGFIGLLRF